MEFRSFPMVETFRSQSIYPRLTKVPIMMSNDEKYREYRSSNNISLRPPQINHTARRLYKFQDGDLHDVLYGYQGKPKNISSLSSIQMQMMKPSLKQLQGSNIPHPKLPPSLQIKEIVVGTFIRKGVFASDVIPSGTRYGPYTGIYTNPRQCEGLKCDCSYSWEVYKEGKISTIIDGSRDSDNWMKYVNCARFNAEQNLALVQTDRDLYYKTIRDISAGEELLVWYGEEYVTYMGVPIARPTKTTPDTSSEKNAIVPTPTGHFPCDRCGKIFSYEYYREKHLKYTRCVDMGDRKFPCDQCERSFEKKDRLRIHVLHVHQKYRPHVCTTCGKRFSQSSSLNKHTRVHTGERPYACPHCPKAFTASSILRTHLRQHNGERPFKCKFCGKAFASHAAHDSHVRRTHENIKKKYSCKICTKSFSLEHEWKYHMNTHRVETTSNDSLWEKNSSIPMEVQKGRWESPQRSNVLEDNEDSLVIVV